MPSSWIVLNAKKPNATPLKCALIIMAAVLTSGDSPVAAHGSAIAQRQDGPAFSDVRKGDSTTSAKGMEGKGWLVGVFGTRRSLMTLALGQVITLFTAGTGICSQYLAQEGINIPTTQSTLNYALLSLHMVWIWGVRRQTKLQVSWWKYALIALADVEANFLVVTAYQYTSITSVMLLDCFAIPCAMGLSYWFLGAKYTPRHYAGVVVCILGLGVLILSDALHVGGGIGGGEAGPQRWKGDLLCLAGASLYAVSNVAQEASIKGGDRVEFLGMLGLWGTAINGAQLLALELGTLRSIQWTGSIAGLIVGFALCLFAMYVLTSHFLSAGDATLFNLSMLTSDLWAVLVGVLLFGQGLSWLYFVALVVIVAGIVLYNSAELRQNIAPPEGAHVLEEGDEASSEVDVVSNSRSRKDSPEQQALLP